MERRDILLGIILSRPRYSFQLKTPELLYCSHTFIANSFPQWIVDMGVAKYTIEDNSTNNKVLNNDRK